jgi:nucleotide-binding universal stress UspA family protein
MLLFRRKKCNPMTDADRAPSVDQDRPLPVVAGFDGSEIARGAARLAAQEAVLRGAPLSVVYAFTWPWIYPPLIDASGTTEPDPRLHALRLVTECADQLREQHPGLDVSGRVIDGHAATVLVDRSRQARLLVVGHRGAGGFRELLVGSTAVHAAAHAACPVLVSRGGPVRTDAPVLAGVDSSAGAQAALCFAFDLADRRKVPVLVVSVLPIRLAQPDTLASAGYPPPAAPDAVGEAVADCARDFPGVPARIETLHDGSPAPALLRASRQAGIVVVGSRGLSGLRGMLLGSVGRALIEHSSSPVVVVRGAAAANS